MKKYNDITIFILAGGKSSRMGQDKGLVAFNGKPMIMHAIEKAKCLCDNIFINSNNPKYLNFGYPLVGDIYKGVGPLGGLHACLSVSKTKYNLLMPCDMPLISNALIEKLIENRQKASIVMPQHPDGNLEPVLSLYSTELLPFTEKLIKEKRYRIDLLLDMANHYLMPVGEVFNEAFQFQFLNVNTINQLNYEILS